MAKNAQVRLKAAITTLAVVLAEARGTLQLINDRAEFPQAAGAIGILMSVDAGRYVSS